MVAYIPIISLIEDAVSLVILYISYYIKCIDIFACNSLLSFEFTTLKLTESLWEWSNIYQIYIYSDGHCNLWKKTNYEI